MISKVVKSSGITEEFSKDKILKVIEFACENTEADPQAILDAAMSSITDGMNTKDIQKQVIKAATNMISVEEPDYQYVAGRLTMYTLRKDVYGQFDPISLYDHISKLVDLGFYDKDLLKQYSPADIEYLNLHIDHSRDMNFTYAGAMQLKEKYLVRNRVTKEMYETPQFLYMGIAMALHQSEKENRLQHVINYYNAASLFKISIPTPILGGARTPTRQFSSCVKIESGDSLKSINDTSASIISYISQRAGIGINAGAIRAEGSPIRNGEATHTGVIPFYKHFHTAVKSCSQGALRGGSATLNYPMWHLEVEKLLVLKNNKGTDETRIRGLDYSVHINKLFLERLRDDGYITLFSPDVDCGRLYEDFYDADDTKFRKRYASLEMNHVIRKKRIKASELFTAFATERAGTGRIYCLFVDNMNKQTPYKEKIKMSNLCQEIFLPTYAMGSNQEEIALCTLSAINLGMIESTDDYLELARIVVRSLDNLLDYQDYPVKQALAAKKRRALGVGVVNLAYFLAKNYVGYNDKAALALVHEHIEAMQFSLLQASMELAKERGRSEWHDRTKWADGLLPIDWYNKNVDDLTPNDLKQDWEWLRGQIRMYGLRNDTVTAQMPAESSSQLLNATNGIEPVRSLVSVKASKDGSFNQVVPDVEFLADEYEPLWKMVNRGGMTGYLSICAVIQKFFDQGISANTSYIPSNYEDNKLPIHVILRDVVFANKYGMKSLYYHNTRDGSEEGIEVTKEADCAGCSI
ncbi:putative ribonucleotide reductase, alpha subunit [Aeromonas phage P19]|nr:putative ribonucleotide reductase, alpha subunit [Aeromonas phage P19]